MIRKLPDFSIVKNLQEIGPEIQYSRYKEEFALHVADTDLISYISYSPLSPLGVISEQQKEKILSTAGCFPSPNSNMSTLNFPEIQECKNVNLGSELVKNKLPKEVYYCSLCLNYTYLLDR